MIKRYDRTFTPLQWTMRRIFESYQRLPDGDTILGAMQRLGWHPYEMDMRYVRAVAASEWEKYQEWRLAQQEKTQTGDPLDALFLDEREMREFRRQGRVTPA